MSNPKVSVIVPVYGVEKYIERCARSLFEQTLDDIEFLFIDDCSPDKSIEVLKKVLENYPHRKHQIVLHRMEHNSGQAAVREWGIKNATGDYIIHCDSDDWVDVRMYETLYNKAVSENADVVVCDYIVTDGKDSNTIVNACHSKDLQTFIENCLLQRDPWSLCNKLFNLRAYSKIEYPTGAMGEDMTIMLQLLWNCHKLAYVTDSLYYYYQNSNSITKKRTINDCLRNYSTLKSNTDILFNILSAKPLTPKMKDGLLHIRYNVLSMLYPIIWESKHYNVWRTTYTNFIIKFLLARNIQLSDKLRILLALAHLYPRKRDRIYE